MRLADFAGLWTMTREIEDAHGGRTGSLAGVARLTPVPGGLAYHEEGLLRLGDGPALAASRRHLWREAGGAVEVLFEDGRLFHRFDPAEPASDALHDCAPDLYRVRYDFSRLPSWRTEWRVVGPRKEYALFTLYEPAHDAARKSTDWRFY